MHTHIQIITYTIKCRQIVHITNAEYSRTHAHTIAAKHSPVQITSNSTVYNSSDRQQVQ